MSQAAKVRLKDLDIQPYMITKLKMAGIQSVFDLAISIPYYLIDIGGGWLLDVIVDWNAAVYNRSSPN